MKTRTRYDYSKLRGFIVENKMTTQEFANILNITRQGLYNKLNSKSSFTFEEINTVKKHFRLSDNKIRTLFFSRDVYK